MSHTTELAARLGEALLHANASVTTAESCTGGGIAEAITRIAGSSAWFEAGYVTYSNRQKTAQLGVHPALFDSVGAVSREVVVAMAQGALASADATFAVAVSGVAGPGGGSADKPVGTVWLAWASVSGCWARRCQFAGDRDSIREHTVSVALQGLTRLAVGEFPEQG